MLYQEECIQMIFRSIGHLYSQSHGDLPCLGKRAPISTRRCGEADRRRRLAHSCLPAIATLVLNQRRHLNLNGGLVLQQE
jgi:hypothetical protein